MVKTKMFFTVTLKNSSKVSECNRVLSGIK